ncbi:molybdenum cofactor guanylyltransferase [Luteimonas kalidii]|uniref:NTP transferase domain-containing protein n=1 Tax=Luteimonas kalidii TaxID=3042025 RepID=A0ABT6JUI8_9GAMM|nr:NTP transferase domain-containing protein [Luteimonas kalidii]MDH5833616.1 NTP transferase domain-containing protein [Luteimonas kalidii]
MDPIARDQISLGLLAGGRARRLGGLDKAWLVRGGVPQVLRLATCFGGQVAQVLVSANREPERLAAAGLEPVPDRVADAGPIGALEALAAACPTPWLFTLPVDLVDVDDGVLRMLLAARASDGARARDDDGPQPLVALWRVAAQRTAVADALAAGALAVQALQARLSLAEVAFEGVRFGNLNTPADLRSAGIAWADP